MKKGILSILTVLTVLLFAVGCAADDTTSTEQAGVINVTISIDHGTEILSEKEIEIKENDILLEVMEENFDLEEEGSFIHKIDGVGPEEGEEKSWIYTVNDETAIVGAADYELSDGDDVVFDLQPWE